MSLIKLDIHCGDIIATLKRTRETIPKDTKIMAIAKANAYGLGAVKLCKILDDHVDYFGVATMQEAIEIRNSGVMSNILLLSEPVKRDILKAINFDIDLTVYRMEFIEFLDNFLKNLQKRKSESGENPHSDLVSIGTHLKVETGMQRVGASDKSVINYWLNGTCKNLRKTGMFSHLANADYTGINQILNFQQYEKFHKLTEKHARKNPGIIRHLCNSYATEFYPGAHFDMVRIGQNLYKSNFKMSVMVKHVFRGQKNETIGYGCDESVKYKCVGNEKLATLGIGFADCVPTSLSNDRRVYVLIKGVRCELVSPVMMDMLVVKCPEELDVEVEDEAVFLSDGRDGAMSLEYLNKVFGIHMCELMTRFGRRFERIYHV